MRLFIAELISRRFELGLFELLQWEDVVRLHVLYMQGKDALILTAHGFF